jgi:hypothetical protein
MAAAGRCAGDDGQLGLACSGRFVLAFEYEEIQELGHFSHVVDLKADRVEAVIKR